MKSKKQIFELSTLFPEVQIQSVFDDNKTFVDCIPKESLDVIEKKYQAEKSNKDFDLRTFVLKYFDLPKVYTSDFVSDTTADTQKHIEKLWNYLTRTDELLGETKDSLIPLPHPYIVPGGRFREIYYWDSYFSMLGLQLSKRVDLIQGMVDNFAYLIETIGYIPNGNRQYFIGRSQPPFFSFMVELLIEEKGEDILLNYVNVLEKEYDFWMSKRSVQLKDGEVLNRYYDELNTPRPESYREDVELAHEHPNPSELWRNLRAACESGWDFSTRWFKDPQSFASIHTSEIIPIDLNCLLLNLENVLLKAYQLKNETGLIEKFENKISARKAAIQKYCWNEAKGFYFDYDFVAQSQKNSETLAAVFPLFMDISTQAQAEKVAINLEKKFLKKGGLLTSIENSGQQWDSPNGWAPLQWIAFKGLKNYAIHALADSVKKNWLQLNDQIYHETGKMTEKYDVLNEDLHASGGEYPNQDGFGWTNGVYLMLKHSY